MSPRSRGVISRVLTSYRLSRSSKPCHRQLVITLFQQSRIAPPGPVSASCFHPPRLNLPRYFSTTGIRQSQTPQGDVTSILPTCCPGCGAFTQTIEPNEPGYYSKSRKHTRRILASRKNADEQPTTQAGDEVLSAEGDNREAVAQPTREIEEELTAPKPFQAGISPEEALEPDNDILESPSRTSFVCDRCHDLIHHNKAVSAPKPSILSIKEFLNESPYKNNRVYHIVDAADFPMSLVPHIHQALSLQEQRSRNRRASDEKYSGGRKLPTLEFVITRSDLLAATKEQVDSKMQYIRTVLRDSLGRDAKDVRLGNVHMISAHRGWWTKQVKEEIRQHGGGIWIVGKANVGKSNFIEACFPKDSRSAENMAEWIQQQREKNEIPNQREASLLDPDSLLPPAPQEDLYPTLPVVSSIPGTTVSPIRIPFGRGKGEVIDLPGMERGQLEDFVRNEHKRDLIMTKRIKPERCAIKPGQSLLLGGGLIRITPVNPDGVVMAACFVPIETHITRTEKAIEMQTEQRPYPGKVIMNEGTGKTIASAGKFDLKWDVTSSNLPTSVAKAVKDRSIPIPQLPYRVFSADILVEGCGWIEVSAQVRAKRSSGDESPSYPQIEIFTPEGKHIGSRPPIESWNFIAEKQKADRRKQPRLRFRYK